MQCPDLRTPCAITNHNQLDFPKLTMPEKRKTNMLNYQVKKNHLKWPNFQAQLSLKLPRFGIFFIQKNIRAGGAGDNIAKLNLDRWDLSKISRAVLINQDRGFEQLSMVLLLIKIWSCSKRDVCIYLSNHLCMEAYCE